MEKIKDYVLSIFPLVGIGFLMGFLVFMIFGIKAPENRTVSVVSDLYKNIDSEETHIFVKGQDIASDIEKTAIFVSTDIFSWLPLLPAGHYAFLLADDSWILAVDAVLSERHVNDLHGAFASNLSPAYVRERTVPSGVIVKDVVSDMDGVATSRETIRGFDLVISSYGDRAFVTAIGDGVVIMGNIEELVRRCVNQVSGF